MNQDSEALHAKPDIAQLLIVSGTRPEIIKLAPVYHALQQTHWARPIWLHTGQHGDMAAQMLDCFHIQPDHVLQRQGSSLLEFATGCRTQLESVLTDTSCEAVIVQGDTESAFQGALAGFYLKVPVVHVEAGLRTYNLHRPFPEEGLRQMIGRIASLHLAPTPRAQQALERENVAKEKIELTGNTVVDAQLWASQHHHIHRRMQGRGHILVTMHRRENWGPDVDHVCEAIAEIAREFPQMPVLFPVHLNPVVKEPVHRLLGGLPNVKLTEPLDYLAMQQALADAWLVLTDSGGLQEEAPTFKVPVLVLRDETERPEVLEAGCAALVGADRSRIVQSVRHLMHDDAAYRSMQASSNPFGDGTAAQRTEKRLHQMLRPDHAGLAQKAAERTRHVLA
ncbi:UDP-N-acetylglucosamine 2-epimerase (non-hydrolyzing) [Comamonas thiooxydans]|uniref:non-hydrolyzing UDP-N-acetylglucosamine 2-epimerase n=1 Tax=Comamonas thiooxydans TaxID=363952 RepID=UPI0007102AA0|nr:UDP-N-acetylglucosamine 2-epimerase (non-hydrolyzing) [Comamonas thiooxydans]